MRKLIILMSLLLCCVVPVYAADFSAPAVQGDANKIMPEADSFGEGLIQMIKKALPSLQPDLHEANKVSVAIIGSVMLISVLQPLSGQGKSVMELAGTGAVSASLLLSANSLIKLGAQTVTEISEYAKLFLPVMTAALAAQGRGGTSAALYAGSAFFMTVLNNLISGILVPVIYIYLSLAVAYGATGQEMIKQLREYVKNAISWCLKTLLTCFTGYMGLTGVISGSTDAAALKAAKAVISAAVPVVGGILSDASEAVLLSVDLAKNAAGIYGIFAVLAIFLGPFLKIGVQYVILKATCVVCSVFSVKRITELISDYSSAMGLLLAMTGSVCLMSLISTGCFLRGAS